MKILCSTIILLILISGCQNNSNQNHQNQEDQLYDSIELVINQTVQKTSTTIDSLKEAISLRYSIGENESYTVQEYTDKNVGVLIKEEHYSNTFFSKRNIYLVNDQVIFIQESKSDFSEEEEVYEERNIYINQNKVYSAYSKNIFNDSFLFEDTLFDPISVDNISFSIEKPLRALHQEGEYKMYFDEFLIIEPQSYLIVQNADSTINAALFIKQGDSLLDLLYSEQASYKGAALKVNHYFEQSNGIERMIYDGAKLAE